MTKPPEAQDGNEGRELASLARELRDLHQSGDPLVLVNAWDTASAQAVAALGARAIGTSSAAMAASLGVPDAPNAPIDTLFDAIGRIANAVDIPVTADLFDGYGLPADELVARLLAAGAVGCNIEDSDHAHPGQLLDATTVATRLREIRSAASRAGVDVVLNARTDCLLHIEDHGAAVSEIINRARLYIDAGADCVFPAGMSDPRTARTVVDAVQAPINAGWNPDVELSDLIAAGVHRISLGPQAHRYVMAAFDDFARPLLHPQRRAVQAESQDYATSFLVDQTTDEAFAAITNVRGWWSENIDGSTDTLGGEFRYSNQDIHSARMRITELVPDQKVVWHVLENHFKFTEDQTEWTGTDIVFEVVPKDGQTEVRLTHRGLVPEHECFDVCSNAWGFYINGSLRSLITTGAGQPNPKEDLVRQ